MSKPILSKKQYLIVHGQVCPFCGFAQVEGGSINVENGYAFQEVWCLSPDCDMTWTDTYLLINALRVDHESEDTYLWPEEDQS